MRCPASRLRYRRDPWDGSRPDGLSRQWQEICRGAELAWRAAIPLPAGLAQTAADYIARHQSGTEVRL